MNLDKIDTNYHHKIDQSLATSHIRSGFFVVDIPPLKYLFSFTNANIAIPTSFIFTLI